MDDNGSRLQLRLGKNTITPIWVYFVKQDSYQTVFDSLIETISIIVIHTCVSGHVADDLLPALDKLLRSPGCTRATLSD